MVTPLALGPLLHPPSEPTPEGPTRPVLPAVPPPPRHQGASRLRGSAGRPRGGSPAAPWAEERRAVHCGPRRRPPGKPTDRASVQRVLLSIAGEQGQPDDGSGAHRSVPWTPCVLSFIQLPHPFLSSLQELRWPLWVLPGWAGREELGIGVIFHRVCHGCLTLTPAETFPVPSPGHGTPGPPRGCRLIVTLNP